MSRQESKSIKHRLSNVHITLDRYKGPRAVRFKTLPQVTGDIGPGCYELNTVKVLFVLIYRPPCLIKS